MKTLFIFSLFFLCFSHGEGSQLLRERIKTRTSGQLKSNDFLIKKDSQNETVGLLTSQKTLLARKEKKNSSGGFQLPGDLESEIQSLKNNSLSRSKSTSQVSSDNQIKGKKTEELNEDEVEDEDEDEDDEVAEAEEPSSKKVPALKRTKKSQEKTSHLPSDLKSEIKSLKSTSPSFPTQREESSRVSLDLDAFEKLISVLDGESANSERYKKEVHSLETSFYNGASFDSLEVLTDLFEKKEDRDNQIKVLEIMVLNYPDIARGHYLLGMGYKKVYLKETEEKNREKARQKAIKSFSQAIKLERRYQEAYRHLLPLLTEEGHTPYSLELIKDMIRYFNNSADYSFLCEAYYENNFVKQTRKACTKAIDKESENPKNHLFLAFVQEKEKDIKEWVDQTADNFSTSYEVQFRAGVFFLKSNPVLAIKYLKRAIAIQPQSHVAHSHLAWHLFHSGKLEKSREHFLQSCLHSKGESMKDFQKAEISLRYKKEPSVAKKWREGINSCFQSLKEGNKKTKAVSN